MAYPKAGNSSFDTRIPRFGLHRTFPFVDFFPLYVINQNVLGKSTAGTPLFCYKNPQIADSLIAKVHFMCITGIIKSESIPGIAGFSQSFIDTNPTLLAKCRD